MAIMNAEGEDETLAQRSGALVRALCARFGLKQIDVARLLGVSQSQVSQRFRGAFAFTLPELETLAEWFSTSPAYLLGFATEPVPKRPARPKAECEPMPSSTDS